MVPHHQASTQAGFPAMNPANLANMYAAYFPYYMNQFPGANPYGSSATGYGHPQAAFAALNKYPLYPTSAAPPTATGMNSTSMSAAGKATATSMYGGAGAGYYPQEVESGVAADYNSQQSKYQSQFLQQSQQNKTDFKVMKKKKKIMMKDNISCLIIII